MIGSSSKVPVALVSATFVTAVGAVGDAPAPGEVLALVIAAVVIAALAAAGTCYVAFRIVPRSQRRLWLMTGGLGGVLLLLSGHWALAFAAAIGAAFYIQHRSG